MSDLFEWAAAAIGVASVWLASREHLASWPLGLLNVSAYAWIFFRAGLFANAGLQLAYIGLNAVGWWRWRHRGPNPLSVTRTPRLGYVWLLGAVAGLALALRPILQRAGGAAPSWDALLTAGSLVAQWQLTRKRADTWAWWMAVNAGYVWLLAKQELWPSVAQYAVFLAIAVQGHRRWWRIDTSAPVAT